MSKMKPCGIHSESFNLVETNLRSTSTPALSHPLPYVPEPNISFLEKFVGLRSCLRGFVNQIRLIIQLKRQWHASDFSQVGLVSSLQPSHHKLGDLIMPIGGHQQISC
mgnify:CR=1 FL=1